MKMVIFALVAAMVCVGCDKKNDAAPTSQPEKAAEAKPQTTLGPLPTAVPAAAPVAANEDDDTMTQADFEAEAEKDINKDSVDSEVDKLAKEIGE